MSKKENVRKLVLTAILLALVIVLQLVCGISIGPFSITLTLVPIVVGAILLGPAYGSLLGFAFGLIVSIMSIIGKDPGGHMVFQANPVIAWILCLLKGTAAGFIPAITYKLFTKVKHSSQILVAISGAFIALGCFALGRTPLYTTQTLEDGSVVFKSGSICDACGHITSSAGFTAVVCVLIALAAAGYFLLLHYALRGENAPFYLASMVSPIANTGIFIIGMMLFFRPLLEQWAGGSDVVVFALTGLAGINFVIEFAIAIIFAPAIALIVKSVRK